MPNKLRRPVKPLSILQANVGKGAIPHEIALSLANDSFIDIILIQEPYVFADRKRKITKNHPAYEAFTPSDDWTERPRVIAYVCKKAGLYTTQLRPCISRDLIFLKIHSINGPTLTIGNVYNAPVGSKDAGLAMNSLFEIPKTFWRSVFLAGDFNIHHKNWDPNCLRQSTLAIPFVQWLDKLEFKFTSKVNESTHKAGGVLDLAFLTGPLQAVTTKAEHMDTTSDHSPLYTTVNWDKRYSEPEKRLRFETIDPERFIDLLYAALTDALIPADDATLTDLDTTAAKLVESINQAYTGSAKRALGQSSGQPWWNADCKTAIQEHRDQFTDKTARKLRNTVRKAKIEFWRNKLDSVKEITDVFKMTKWHQSTGNYRSPPLIDPQDPTAIPANSISEKRELLIKELLTNSAEAGDIPFDSPTVKCREIPFPEITVHDIRKSILKTGNTAPGIDEITTKVLQLAWPLIESHVLKLFQLCLSCGHHPASFL
jgi:endonuclease/exonuclease/phosphatase (EEP) superfamily protein YafD